MIEHSSLEPSISDDKETENENSDSGSSDVKVENTETPQDSENATENKDTAE